MFVSLSNIVGDMKKVTIEINVAEYPYLRDFYIARKNALAKQMADVDEILEKISNDIISIQALSPISTSNIDSSGYDKSWNWVPKIKFIIKEAKKPCSTAEIVAGVLDHEPERKQNRKKVVASVSSVLSSNHGEGKPFSRAERNNTSEFEFDLQ